MKVVPGPVVQIDEGRIQAHLDEVVRSTVEETLNALLDAEADHLCGARKYERTEGRKDTRAGSYDRHLQTKAGEVKLTVPKLRNLPFETAIIERYRRRESSVEEALIEMYLAGVSVRRVEDITQALWGTRCSASTVSDLNQKIYGKINEWRERPLVGDFPYVFLDGLWLKRKRTPSLSITHKFHSVDSEVNVGESRQPTPQDRIAGRAIVFAMEIAAESGHGQDVVGHVLLIRGPWIGGQLVQNRIGQVP